jgi:hypothetical protein
MRRTSVTTDHRQVSEGFHDETSVARDDVSNRAQERHGRKITARTELREPDRQLRDNARRKPSVVDIGSFGAESRVQLIFLISLPSIRPQAASVRFNSPGPARRWFSPFERNLSTRAASSRIDHFGSKVKPRNVHATK